MKMASGKQRLSAICVPAVEQHSQPPAKNAPVVAQQIHGNSKIWSAPLEKTQHSPVSDHVFWAHVQSTFA
jgi:hypothetical protein